MKRVTKNNLLKFIELKKKYLKQDVKNKQLLTIINDFTENVINKDKHYYGKVKDFNFSEEELKYLMWKVSAYINKDGGKNEH